MRTALDLSLARHTKAGYNLGQCGMLAELAVAGTAPGVAAARVGR